MEDRKERLKNLINSMSTNDFTNLIKKYYKTYYNTEDIRICDGPYDGGNDLEIFLKGKEIKKNIQITVQKTGIDKKIEKDLKKAKNNVNKYDYLKELIFHTNQNIPKDSKNEMIKNAEINFEINLKIIDANTLVELSEQYIEIKIFTYELYGIKTDELKIKDNNKIIYDLLSEGKDTIDVKENFIFSYILTFLFENGDSTPVQIYYGLKDVFGNIYSEDHFRGWLNNLHKQGELDFTSERKYKLTKSIYDRIKDITIETLYVENELKSKIKFLLKENNINGDVDELFNLLITLYQNNYEIDIDELSEQSNSFENSLKKIYNELVQYFIKLKISDANSKKYTKDLIDICEESNYLKKIGITICFTKLFKSNKLEKYVNEKKHWVYLDTQILLRLICLLQDPNINKEGSYEAISNFYESVNYFKNKIKLYTTSDYINEVVAHLFDAIRLDRFSKCEFLYQLGQSSNVFYNFFLLIKKEKKYNSVLDFIKNLYGSDLPKYYEDNFFNKVFSKLRGILEKIDIFTNNCPEDGNYFKIKRLYEIELGFKHINRAPATIKHDVRTLTLLSNTNYHIDDKSGYTNNPYLITWDSFFYTIKPVLFDKLPNLDDFYIYSPSKYINVLSTSSFGIDPSYLKYNIIALVEDKYNINSKTTFFDLISSFFNKEDISKWNLAKKLVELKEKSKKYIDKEKDTKFEEDQSPLTDVLLNLRNYYWDKHRFQELINVFEDSNLEDKILQYLDKGIRTFIKINNLDESNYKDFNGLIESKI